VWARSNCADQECLGSKSFLETEFICRKKSNGKPVAGKGVETALHTPLESPMTVRMARHSVVAYSGDARPWVELGASAISSQE